LEDFLDRCPSADLPKPVCLATTPWYLLVQCLGDWNGVFRQMVPHRVLSSGLRPPSWYVAAATVQRHGFGDFPLMFP
jgi:hypothetical protein